MNETTAYLPGLSPVENKDLCARFDGIVSKDDLIEGIWGGRIVSDATLSLNYSQRGVNRMVSLD